MDREVVWRSLLWCFGRNNSKLRAAWVLVGAPTPLLSENTGKLAAQQSWTASRAQTVA